MLRQRWDDAQQLLLAQFEDPELWQPMQRANATFDSLCVAVDHISAADPAGRRIRLNLTARTPPPSPPQHIKATLPWGASPFSLPQ